MAATAAAAAAVMADTTVELGVLCCWEGLAATVAVEADGCGGEKTWPLWFAEIRRRRADATSQSSMRRGSSRARVATSNCAATVGWVGERH